MISRMDLVNRILYLFPDAKFSVWETNDFKKYHGDENPLFLFNMFIDWNKQNIDKCPTEEDIKNIDQKLFDEHCEKLRKQQRDDNAKNDLSLRSGYVAYMRENIDKTFSDYLDYLESLQV